MSQGITKPGAVKLVKARIDFSSQKTQLIFSLVAMLLPATAVYVSTANLGFVGSDYTVLHMVASAANGGAAGFSLGLANQTISNLGYGSLAMAMLIIDFVVWHIDAAAYHIESVILYILCAATVGHIAAQLVSRSHSRLAPAAMVWAGLLYAVYPAHAHAVCWVSGTADLLCEFLSLTAISLYLRFRALREQPYFIWSLIIFVLSLLAKVQAIAVPAVITFCELIVMFGDQAPAVRRALFPTAYWMTLFFVSTLALVFPWALPVSPAHALSSSWLALHEVKTWYGLAALPSDNPMLLGVICAAYLAAFAVLAIRFTKATVFWWLLLWPLSWMLFSVVSDSHMMSSTFGLERLLLFPSAPLCILLVLLCLPTIDSISRVWACRLSMAGSVLLVVILGSYMVAFEQNAQYWQTMAAETEAIKQAVLSVAQRLPKGQGILVAELPPRLSGDWVRFAFSEPFTDLNRLIQAVPAQVLQSNAIWPSQMVSAIISTKCGAVVRWDTESGPIVEYNRPEGAGEYAFEFDDHTLSGLVFDPPAAAAGASSQNQIPSVKLKGGNKPTTVWLPAVSLNPLKLSVAQLELTQSHNKDNKLRIVWEATNRDTGKHQLGSAAIVYQNSGKYWVWLGRYPRWTLNKTITRLGLQLPAGNFSVDVSSLKLIPHTVAIPMFSLRAGGRAATATAWPFQLAPSEGATLEFNASQVPGATGVRIYIWDATANFTSSSEAYNYEFLPSNGVEKIFHGDFMTTEDTITLSSDLFVDHPSPVYYMRAVAVDKDHHLIGLPTEPLSFSFKTR